MQEAADDLPWVCDSRKHHSVGLRVAALASSCRLSALTPATHSGVAGAGALSLYDLFQAQVRSVFKGGDSRSDSFMRSRSSARSTLRALVEERHGL